MIRLFSIDIAPTKIYASSRWVIVIIPGGVFPAPGEKQSHIIAQLSEYKHAFQQHTYPHDLRKAACVSDEMQATIGALLRGNF